jgi:hypothetical protein
LKEILKFNLINDFTKEELEKICYIICTQSGYNGTSKSCNNEDQIKCQIKKKIKHDLYEFWELDKNVVFCANSFISFITIYLTRIKLQQSINEKEFGEVHNKFAKNRTKKKIETTRSMQKFRDKKLRKADIRKQGWHLDV